MKNILKIASWYAVTAIICILALDFFKTQAVPIWPPSGLAVCWLAIYGRDAGWGIWLGSMIANFVAALTREHSADVSFLTSWFICWGNSAQAFLVVQLMEKWQIPRDFHFERLRHIGLYLVAIILGGLLAAFNGGLVVSSILVPNVTFATVASTWFMGDVFGMLTVPFVFFYLKARYAHNHRQSEIRLHD